MFALMMSTAAMHGQQTPVAPTCSNATLTGAYGVSSIGTQPAPSVLPNLLFVPGSIEQAIGLSIQIFDGQGSFSQTDNMKGSASGVTTNRSGSGTYSINSDCTGMFTLIMKAPFVPVVTQIVVVDSGAEFRGVVVSPQTMMLSANGRKMH